MIGKWSQIFMNIFRMQRLSSQQKDAKDTFTRVIEDHKQVSESHRASCVACAHQNAETLMLGTAHVEDYLREQKAADKKSVTETNARLAHG